MKRFSFAAALALLSGMAAVSQGYELTRSLGVGYGPGYHADACCGGGHHLGRGGGYFGCCEHPLPHHDHLWANYCAPRGHGGFGMFGASCREAEPCCDGCCEPPGAGLRRLFSWCRDVCEPICYEPEPCCDDGCGSRFSLKGLLPWRRDCCEPVCCEPDPCYDDCCGPKFSLKGLLPWRRNCCEPVCCEPDPCCNDCCAPKFSLKGLLPWRRNCGEPVCCEPDPCCDDCYGRRFNLKKLFSWGSKCCPHDGYGHESYDVPGPSMDAPIDDPADLPPPPTASDRFSLPLGNPV